MGGGGGVVLCTGELKILSIGTERSDWGGGGSTLSRELKILSIGTERSDCSKLSDQGLHSLPFHLRILDVLLNENSPILG